MVVVVVSNKPGIVLQSHFSQYFLSILIIVLLYVEEVRNTQYNLTPDVSSVGVVIQILSIYTVDSDWYVLVDFP